MAMEMDWKGFQAQNNVTGNLNYYKKGLDLAEAGKYEEALTCMQQYLRISPEDAQALNDTGAILHCLKSPNEAIDYFIKARTLQADSGEILWNLVEAYLVIGKPHEAAKLFGDMEQMNLLNPDILNRTANVFLNEDDKAYALETLLYSLQLWPNQEVLKPMVEIMRKKRPKIAFFCGADGTTFLNEIINFTEQRFETRIFDGQTEDDLHELMKWSDISWFEWCTDLAAMASKLPKTCKTIVRLHRYEAYLHWPEQVNWDNIDILITIGNSFVKETLRNKVPHIESTTSIITIPNGVNLKKYYFNNKQRGKNIAFLGNLRMVKNPAFILQCMQKLHYIDPDCRLFFGGVFQDPTLEQYVRHMVNALELSDVVFFDGWLDNSSRWLEDKHYIVSTSIIESQGMGLLEGMACGLKPVIHNFPGASEIYPREFLFNISEEFCEQILSESYEPQRYRRFVEENYLLKNQLRKINEVFANFEKEMDLQPQSTITDNASSLNIGTVPLQTIESNSRKQCNFQPI
jgi:tetratricopeptide (TPR) repeat protein